MDMHVSSMVTAVIAYRVCARYGPKLKTKPSLIGSHSILDLDTDKRYSKV